MKKTFKKILTAVLVIAMAVTGVVGMTSCDDGEVLPAPKFSSDTIRIGASGPLTGDAAVYGEAVYNGAKLAIHEINEKGGLNGVLFSFEMFDDQHKPEMVSTGYANLYEKGMDIPRIDYNKVEKIVILGHGIEADKVFLDNILKKCHNIKEIIIFRYEGEPDSSYDSKADFFKKYSANIKTDFYI